MKPSLKVKLYNPNFLITISFAVCIVCTLILFPFLPGELPMQFSNTGNVNWTLPKIWGVLCIPAIAAVITAGYMKSERFTFAQFTSVTLLLILDIGFLGYIAFIR